MTRAQKIIAQAGLKENEAILLSKPSNIFYASGFTGEGIALLANGLCAVITDFRYTEQAERQAADFSIEEIKLGQAHAQLAFELLKGAGINAVRFEDDKVTVAGFNAIKSDMPGIRFSPLNGAVEQVRRIKDEGEIALIEKACAISDHAFERLLGKLKEGMTETEVRIALEFDMLALGADGFAFDTIVASGENGSLCHAIPGPRKLRKGDLITIDFGAKVGGYCADMTRTVALSTPCEELRRIYATVLRAQETAQAALCAGRTGFEIDKLARDIINQAGYEGCFGHGLGHSLGIDIHENPRCSVSCNDVLEENMLMTVEPGIYKAGLGGVRIENTVLVGKDASRPLTHSPKELLIL